MTKQDSGDTPANPKAQPETPVVVQVNAPKRSGWPLALVLVALVVVGVPAVTVLLIMKQCSHIVDKVTDLPKGIFKSEKTTVITTTVQKCSKTPKLVVYTADMQVTITKTVKDTLWGKIGVGEGTVRIQATGNRVQYFIPIGKLKEDAFVYDKSRNVLQAYFPKPVLDEEVVDIQSDPAKIDVELNRSWIALVTMSGEFLKDEARAELRPAAITQGKEEWLADLALTNAEKVIREFLYEPLVKELSPGVTLEVVFK